MRRGQEKGVSSFTLLGLSATVRRTRRAGEELYALARPERD
jgi:hypothetical protein